MAMKESTKEIFNYVKSMDGQNITAEDISKATGIPLKSVNGSIGLGFVKKGLMVKVPATIEVDGEQKEVKFVQLTDAGRAFDPDAPATK